MSGENDATMWLLKDSAFFISLFLFKILYLPAVRLQGREDDAGVFSFINEWPDKFRLGLHVYIFIYSGEVCGRYADDACLI